MANLDFFRYTTENGETVFKSRPQTKSKQQLLTALEKGAEVMADKFIEQYILGLQWQVFENWQDAVVTYELDLAAAEQYNLNEQELEDFEPMPLPVEPTDCDAVPNISVEAVKTWPEFAKIFKAKEKRKGFEFKGVDCSVTESDQNGWGSITTLLNLADNAGVAFSPVNFVNENGNVVTLDTRAEWDAFVLAGATKRAEFF